jgi:hypothetical protein
VAVPCRSPPQGESFEIPAGLFDDDFGIRPDKHIFVDFMPPWDDVKRELPAYTRRQIYELLAGRSLPEGFVAPSHVPPGE